MKTVSVNNLKIGMFVAELDRPWEGTPFLFQGILIESEEEIAQLVSLCKTVQVDPLHSKPGACDGLPDDDSTSAPLSDLRKELLRFLEIARSIQKPLENPSVALPEIDSKTLRSNLEEEILYSAQFIDGIQQRLREYAESLRAKRTIDLVPIDISKLTDSASRNLDAVLWLCRLKATGDYDIDHAVDVLAHLVAFGRFLDLPRQKVEHLGVGGLLQDIGTLLSPFEETSVLFTEMAGLIDIYCAIIRKRPHAEVLTAQQAIAKLIALRGTRFRESLVDQFIQCVGFYPLGTLVELNTGEVAIVLRVNPTRRLQPQVFTFLNVDHSLEHYPRELDLSLSPLTPTGEEAYRIVRGLPEEVYGMSIQNLFRA
ncbi:MAG: DUF3391 domain-containing protein [Zoogloeaceae bacterium]|jgi:HD-GYP domain-containing protein (c-di-GMP phosphodiesterase class II)|nr:DUF3391 domain-containing protein [Zoogloeaceae bacterium]